MNFITFLNNGTLVIKGIVWVAVQKSSYWFDHNCPLTHSAMSAMLNYKYSKQWIESVNLQGKRKKKHNHWSCWSVEVAWSWVVRRKESSYQSTGMDESGSSSDDGEEIISKHLSLPHAWHKWLNCHELRIDSVLWNFFLTLQLNIWSFQSLGLQNLPKSSSEWYQTLEFWPSGRIQWVGNIGMATCSENTLPVYQVFADTDSSKVFILIMKMLCNNTWRKTVTKKSRKQISTQFLVPWWKGHRCGLCWRSGSSDGHSARGGNSCLV